MGQNVLNNCKQNAYPGGWVKAVEFSRWFLAVFFLLVAGFYTTTILVKKRRAGRSPVVRGKPGSLHRRVHDTFTVFRALILVVCVTRVPWPGLDAALLPITPLWTPLVILTGNALMAVSFAVIVIIHHRMGAHWQSGIEPGGPSRLITDGWFRFSRNPTFLFIQVAQLGLFLSLPSAFTLLCLVVGVAAIQVQVRLEEHHLQERWGEAYRAYMRRVPRWVRLPGHDRKVGRNRSANS
jgi:protein-S-isoprenylcysteine O-methyltransferase Ste14